MAQAQEASLARAGNSEVGIRAMGKVGSGQQKEREGFIYISDRSCHPAPHQPSAGLPVPLANLWGREWCLWNFLISSLGHITVFHLLPGRIGCTIRNPGSSTNLERLDITVVYARINRAWRRAARSCPRANTALCQIGNCFYKGRVCALWAREKQFHQSP